MLKPFSSKFHSFFHYYLLYSARMTIRIAPILTESTRDLGKSALYLLLTIATIKVSHSLYRYLRFLKMSSSSASATDAETVRQNRILSSKLYFDIPLSKVTLYIWMYSSFYVLVCCFDFELISC